MTLAKVRTAWRTFGRHYDDLTPEERRRVLQRMACEQATMTQLSPALANLVCAIELASGLGA